jgi:hypothetical protein
MRKITLFAALLLALALNSKAQSIEFTPLAGYTFGDKVNFSGGTAHISDGFTYGGAFTFLADRYNALEISYTRQDPTVTANYGLNSITNVNEPVGMNYILIGGQRIMPTSDQVNFFGGLNMGLGIMGSKNNTFNTITKFDFGFDLGLKYFFNEKVGLRLQANINFPVTAMGGTMWWGTGGSGYGVTSYVPIVQFAFMGGLVFKVR